MTPDDKEQLRQLLLRYESEKLEKQGQNDVIDEKLDDLITSIRDVRHSLY